MSAPKPVDFREAVRPIQAALHEWALRVDAAAVDNIDRGAPGVVSAFRTDRGELKRSQQVEAPTLRGTSLVGAIVNTAPHAVVAHEGRRPGQRMPPSNVIREWLERQGLSDAEAERAAWPVASAIGRRGVAGNPFLREAKERHEGDLRPMLRAAAVRGLAAAVPPQTL